MAAPADKNIKNLQGKWILVSFMSTVFTCYDQFIFQSQAQQVQKVLTHIQNKTVSDSPDGVLALQGVGWITRKAIGVATITQLLTQNPITGDDGKPTAEIIIEQVGTGGLKGTTERRVLDYHTRGHSDWLFGSVEGRTRYNTLAGLTEENKGKPTEEDVKFLTEGWLPETQEGEVVDAFVENEKSKWSAWQIWGFAEIDGKRMLTRRFVVRRTDKDEVIRIRMSYDWVGEL